MKSDPHSINKTVTPAVAQRVDEVCTRFEQAWINGQGPRIEEFLGDSSGEEYTALLRELIALDAEYRRQRREEPTAEDYLARFPALESALLDKLLAVAPSSRSKAPSTAKPSATRADSGSPSGSPSRIRCPHCKNPIQIAGDPSEEVLCPGCGNSFFIHQSQFTESMEPMRPLGKYQLLERVGVGGFGSVWRARDTALDRIVALKIPHTGLLTSPTELERWHREGRAAAQLRHPGIVAIHDVTMLEGLPVIVSDFIAGVTLRDLLQQRRMTFEEAAMLMAEVGLALDHAHSKGLVHRDIKPANIMLEAAGATRETASAGPKVRHRPVLMDFGLALRAEAEVMMTLDGQIVGTPAYMSPEQAAGRAHSADGRSDVYSLGVIMYELLAGELPFRGSKAMIYFQVIHEEPQPLRRLNDRIPRDLETICLKALSKEPGRRYATARAMADDLQRFLKSEPILARPVGPAQRVWRWCRRNKMVASLLALVVVVFLGGFAGVVTEWQRAEHHAEQAERERTTSDNYWAKLMAQEMEKQKQQAEKDKQLAQVRLEGRKLLADAVTSLDRGDWAEAKVDLVRIVAMIDANPVKDSDLELIELKGRTDVFRVKTNEQEKLALLKIQQDHAKQKAASELIKFREYAGEMQFYAAGADPDTELTRYYDPAKAEKAGLAALEIADGWGSHLQGYPLEPQRAILHKEIHDFLLVLIQVKLRRGSAGPTKEIADLLERARGLNSARPNAYHRLQARYYRLLGNDEQAAREEELSKKVPASTALDYFLQGEDLRLQSMAKGNVPGQDGALANREFLQLAVDQYRLAREKDHGHYWAQFQLGRCYMGLGRLDEAVEALNACIVLRPEAPWGFSSAGLALARLGRYDEAKRLLQRAGVAAFPPAQLNLGVTHILEKDSRSALAKFDAIFGGPADQQLVEAYYYRGHVHLDENHFDQAAADFQAFLAKRNDLPSVYLLLAQALFAQAPQVKTAEANGLDALTKYLGIVQPETKPDSGKAYAERGKLLRDGINLSGPAEDAVLATAKNQLERAIALGAGTAAVFDNLGAVLKLLGNGNGALKAYDKGIELDPKHVKLRLQRGFFYMLAGSNFLARAELLKEKDLLAESEAELRKGQNDLARAEADFEVAVKCEPTVASGHSGLGLVYAYQKKPAQAVRSANLAVLHGGESRSTLHNAACIYALVAPERESPEADMAIALILRAVEVWEKGPRTERSEIDRLPLELRDAFRILRGRPEIEELLKRGKK